MLKPEKDLAIPKQTAPVAQAAIPQGNIEMRI
jgi:hypothetical protein